jgi:hypothetical protein
MTAERVGIAVLEPVVDGPLLHLHPDAEDGGPFLRVHLCGSPCLHGAEPITKAHLDGQVCHECMAIAMRTWAP